METCIELNQELILVMDIKRRYEYFLARLRHEVNILEHGGKAFIAKNSGTTGSFIGQILKRNAKKKASIKVQISIGEFICGSDEQFIREGRNLVTHNHIQATLPPPQTQATATSSPAPCPACGDILDKKLEKHQKLVGGFEYQEVAIDINKGLLILEKMMGRDGLLEVRGIVNQMIRNEEKKRGLTNPANGTERIK